MEGPVQTNGESVSPVAAVIRAGECAFLKSLKQVFDIKVWVPTILKNVEIMGVSKVISMAQNVIGIKILALEFLKLSKYKQCQPKAMLARNTFYLEQYLIFIHWKFSSLKFFSRWKWKALVFYLILTLFAEESKTPHLFCHSKLDWNSALSTFIFNMLRVFYLFIVIYKVPVSRWSIVIHLPANSEKSHVKHNWLLFRSISGVTSVSSFTFL